MSELEAWWKCNECGQKNWINYTPDDLKNKIYACCQCGKVHKSFTVHITDKRQLNCIKYEGMGAEVPTGANIEEATKRKTFGDPNGGTINREQFALKYGWDPLVLFCRQSRNKDHPACEGFDERCTMKGTDIGALIDEITVGSPAPVKPKRPF